MKITKRLLVAMGFKKENEDFFMFQMRAGTVTCRFDKDGKVIVIMPSGFVSKHVNTIEDLFHNTCTNCFHFGAKETREKMIKYINTAL